MTKQLIAHVLPMEHVTQPNGLLLIRSQSPERAEVHIFHSIEQGLAILEARRPVNDSRKFLEFQESIRAAALLPIIDQPPTMIVGAPALTIIEAIGCLPEGEAIEYPEPSDDITRYRVRMLTVTSQRPPQVYGLCLARDSAGDHLGICFSKQQVRDFLHRYNHALSSHARHGFHAAVTGMPLPAQTRESTIEIHGFAAGCIATALKEPDVSTAN